MLENNELYEKTLRSLEKEQQKVQKRFEKLENDMQEYKRVEDLASNFLRKYEKEHELDFEMLDQFLDYLVKNDYLSEKKNYKKLQQMKLKLMADFADRTQKIDDEFKTLFSSCKKLKNEQVSKTKTYQRETYQCKSDLDYCNQIHTILKNISEGIFISTENLKSLQEYIENRNMAEGEEVLEFFRGIVVQNATILEKQYTLVLDRIEKDRKEKAKKQAKVKKSKTIETPAKEVPSENKIKTPQEVVVPEKKEEDHKFKLDLEDEEFRETYEAIKKILEEPFKTNEVFLSYVDSEVLDFEHALIMVDGIGDPLTNIKSLLKAKLLPAIEAGEVAHYKEMLAIYLQEYEIYVDKLDWEKKLRDKNKEELLEKIKTAQDLIEVCEKEQLLEKHGMLKGYFIPVDTRVKEVIEHIVTKGIVDEEYLIEIEQELSNTIPILQEAIEPFVPQKVEQTDLYQNAANLLLFSDTMGIDEMLAEEEHVDSKAYSIVLDGLEKLANDERIITTTAHRVQHNREKTEIKSYSKGNWRIFYKVTKAENLEKIYHRKMNAIYIVGVGFGGMDGKMKSRMIDKVYHASLEREPEFQKFVETLNSGDLEKTMDLIVHQSEKLSEYIQKAKETSFGGDPNAK